LFAFSVSFHSLLGWSIYSDAEEHATETSALHATIADLDEQVSALQLQLKSSESTQATISAAFDTERQNWKNQLAAAEEARSASIAELRADVTGVIEQNKQLISDLESAKKACAESEMTVEQLRTELAQVKSAAAAAPAATKALDNNQAEQLLAANKLIAELITELRSCVAESDANAAAIKTKDQDILLLRSQVTELQSRLAAAELKLAASESSIDSSDSDTTSTTSTSTSSSDSDTDSSDDESTSSESIQAVSIEPVKSSPKSPQQQVRYPQLSVSTSRSPAASYRTVAPLTQVSNKSKSSSMASPKVCSFHHPRLKLSNHSCFFPRRP
jgi:chromosome segregation ATPase